MANNPLLLLPDVSEWQPHTDMAGIKRQNGGAAIIRAADGSGHVDQVFTKLRKDAHGAGFRFLGIYHFVRPDADIKAQAQLFLRLAGKLAPFEVPIIDLEVGNGDLSAVAAEWMAIVGVGTGVRPWLYSGLSFAGAHGLSPIFDGPAIHTWVAAYGDQEPGLGHTLWQCSDGKIGSHLTSWPGAGFCDTSVYHGTIDQLAALTGQAPHPSLHKFRHVLKTAMSLSEFAKAQGVAPSTVLRLTAENSPHSEFAHETATYINDLVHGKDGKLPVGTVLWSPKQ